MPIQERPGQLTLSLTPSVKAWLRDQASMIYGDPKRATRIIEALCVKEMQKQQLAREEMRLRVERSAASE